MSIKLAVCHPFIYTKGGDSRVVLKIAQHYNAPIYCSRYDPENTFPEFKELDVRIISKLPSLPLPKRVIDAAVSGWDYYHLKLSDFDVINAHGTPSEWIRHKNKPVVWYCNSPNRESFDLYDWRMSKRNIFQKVLYWTAINFYRKIEFSTVPNIEYIFANSKNIQKRISEYLKRDSDILNPCVDVKEFYCQGYDKFFFYPSRIVPEKRFEIVIDAFKLFKKNVKGWKLIIAGALSKERQEHIDYYHKLVDLAKTVGDVEIILDLADEKLYELYANCSAVLFSPINEDFGIIPLEAFASYKPCIAVNEGGPKEVITKETGFLVNSPQEMAEKMIILEENPSLAEEMGKNARKRVEKYYTWDRFFERFDKVVEEVAKRQQY